MELTRFGTVMIEEGMGPDFIISAWDLWSERFAKIPVEINEEILRKTCQESKSDLQTQDTTHLSLDFDVVESKEGQESDRKYKLYCDVRSFWASYCAYEIAIRIQV